MNSLVKKLTKKKQSSRSRLFETLDTKISRVYLGENIYIGLIDTVGFINNIPTSLINKLDSFNNDEDLKKFGADYIASLVSALIDKGAPGIHFYTINQLNPTNQIIPCPSGPVVLILLAQPLVPYYCFEQFLHNQQVLPYLLK